MPKSKRHEKFIKAWKRVRVRYEEGFCVSERGLQAHLVSSLELEFHEQKIIVEPSWKTSANHRVVPDVVMINEKTITDIFELKFMPHHYAEFEGDVDKLVNYAADRQASFPVCINTETGEWRDSKYPLSPDLALHFVVVANTNAKAVYPKIVGKCPTVQNVKGRFNHWFGRTGKGCSAANTWNIDFDI